MDGRSDIFSLGGVFYFMLTGRKPFPASDLPTLFHQIQSEDPPPPLGADAPAELSTVIMRALAKKREARYQSCQELLADLDVLRHLYPVEVLPAAVAQPDRPRERGASAGDAAAGRSGGRRERARL